MKTRSILCYALAILLLCALLPAMPALAADGQIAMEPCYAEPFQPEGVTYGQVSFRVPADTQGLTKDGWDNGLDHNTDLILVSFVKDGVAYENMTVRQVKDAFGDLPLKRTCYTYESGPDGSLYLNLRFHMDDHATLKPSDFTAVTVKAGFVWCAGSPSGITGELSALTLDHDVYFPVNAEAGITGVQTGPMPGMDGALRVKFERKDGSGLKAISAVDLCPSAIPGKTLGDLVTINGETVTELVARGNVARFNFYGDTLIFHIDDPAYLAALKEQQYEIVILPGFRWMNWTQDDWGNWAGTNKDKYTPVDGTLVLEPISFSINTADEVCVPTNGMTVVDGYKDTYYVGDRIDMTTLLVSINYVSGENLVMPILESMVSYDFSAPGTATVQIEYDGMTASYTVTVLPALQTEPDSTQPESTEPESTEPESESVTDHVTVPTQDTYPEPQEPGGCKSVMLIPVSAGLLALAALVRKRKED